MTHEIEVKDAEFIKVSTNTYGALRFKTDKETEAVKQYADQISTDNKAYTAVGVRKLSGFKVVTVKDKQRCLKPSTQQTSTDSSKELPTP
ncbi:hypothetical protein [Gimesia algae]|uniref:hypothetical protein n=1 Tax=Gimesia algae TaxID=2527971 RepID=UPI0018D93719|nr:hypothetical protein [Gimesia algae]